MKFFYSKSEKNFFKRAEMKRISEDDYVREEARKEARKKADAEKAVLLERIRQLEALTSSSDDADSNGLDCSK